MIPWVSFWLFSERPKRMLTYKNMYFTVKIPLLSRPFQLDIPLHGHIFNTSGDFEITGIDCNSDLAFMKT